MSSARKRGTAAETALVRYLRAHGFPHADRQPLRGRADQGDIAATAGLVIEVKASATAAAGQPGRMLLRQWLREAAIERANARADYCPLVVKRAGTTDPGRWWAYLPMPDVWALLGVDTPCPAQLDDIDAHVCMSVASLLVWLRGAGYGIALDALGAPGVDTPETPEAPGAGA